MVLSAFFESLNWDMIWEIVGYAASAIVLVSFIMTSVVKLRIVSTIGSALFSLYGFIIGSIPTGIMNAAIAVVNVVYLVRMKKQQDDYFSAYTISVDNEFLNGFLMFNGKDIQKVFGPFDLHATDADVAMLVYCNMTVAALLVGKNLGDGKLRIDLDYATPEYRDMRAGKFLYQRLFEIGYTHLEATFGCERHREYLTSMGFVEKDGKYVQEKKTIR